jgi:uroporphyrinogen III methyltransferase/synthase
MKDGDDGLGDPPSSSDSGGVGKVYLVGGGPGDPGLVTLRGVECLRRADCVLYDYLVNPQILRHAPASAETVCLGKHGRSRIWLQSEINQHLVDLASRGKVVVRLKGGDPAVFAREAEEIDALLAAGIPFEIVPGVTAALAASSYAGIPVTHRNFASAVALVTAHEMSGKDEFAVNYESLAVFPGTLVFYMGVTTAETWTSRLIAAGKPADTPAAIIRRCSLPDQQRVVCTLGEVADLLTPATKFRPPVIVIVGPVTALAERYSWFDRRPLFGQTVLVTRPIEQADQLGDLLAEQGAAVRVQPAIEVGPPTDWQPVDAALERLHEFDWLIFLSANGVHAFFDRLRDSGRDLRAIGPARLGVIGPATAAALREYHLVADLLPDEYRAEQLAAALADQVTGARCLLLRASRGREVLGEGLRAAGAHVEQVVVYQIVDVQTADPEIVEQLEAGEIDWITVTSSAIARSLARLFGEQLGKARLATISPITSQTIRELGFETSAEATEYTMGGVVEAILAVAHQA